MMIFFSASLAFLVHLLMVESPCYYEVLVQNLPIKTLALIVFCSCYQYRCKDNHLLLYIAKPYYDVGSNCKGLFSNILIYFVWPRRFVIFDHNVLPVLIALRYALAAPNIQIAVLCFTSNVSEN